MQEIEIIQENGKAFASSMQVAEHFRKRHDHVLRGIRNLIAKLPEDWARANFGETCSFSHGKVEDTAFLMTRDGFALLAMGFTGKKALQWKLKYIEAFNAMENELRNRIETQAVNTAIKDRIKKILPLRNQKGIRTLIRKVLLGKTAYWGLREGLSLSKAKSIISAIGRTDILYKFEVDEFRSDYLYMDDFITKELYRPDEDDTELASARQMQTIKLLIEACREMEDLGIIALNEYLQRYGVQEDELNSVLGKKRADSIALILYNILENQTAANGAVRYFKGDILDAEQG